MQRVSSLVSRDIGDYLTNYKTWGSVMYNVLEHGLVGDGTTDDTGALQTLINTAIAAGRKAIFFPHTKTGGQYYVTALTNADQVVFFGDNASFVGGFTGTITQIGDWVSSDTLSKHIAPVFNVIGYGAKGDGLTDDSIAIQTAINACHAAGGGVVYFPYTPNGYITTTGNFTLNNNVEIRGAQMVTIYCSATRLFNVSAFGCWISNLKINMNGAPAGSKAIHLKTSLGVVSNVRINNVWFINCYSAIEDESGTTNYLENTIVSDIKCILNKGVQIHIHRSRGFLTFRECSIDHTFNTTAVTWRGAVFEDFMGIELEKFDVVGPTAQAVTPVYQAAAIGISIIGTAGQGTASVWLTRVLVDNTMGDGVYIENVLNLVVNSLEVYQCLGIPLTLKNISVGQLNNVFVIGGVGLTGAVASANGITINGCEGLTIANLRSEDNTGTGVIVNNSINNIFSNVFVKDNTNFGWYEVGTSNRNVVTGANLATNALGNLTQVGTNSAFAHWINNGTFRAHDVGAVTV